MNMLPTTNTQLIKDRLNSFLFTKSAFVSTFIIYITIMFVAIISYIELRKNLIPDITLNFLLILELHVIFTFIFAYIGLYSAVNSGKWINASANIVLFLLNLLLIYLTLSTLITQTSSFIFYSFLLTLTSISLFIQNYLDDKKAKNYLGFMLLLAITFATYVYVINYVFGNALLGTNRFFISQKQVNDSIFFSSIIMLLTMLVSLFNILRIYLPVIKTIDQTVKEN
jgi:hypothetical protein